MVLLRTSADSWSQSKSRISESPHVLELRLLHRRTGPNTSTRTEWPVIFSLHKSVGLACVGTGEFILPPRFWCFARKNHFQTFPFCPPTWQKHQCQPCLHTRAPLRAATPAPWRALILLADKSPSGQIKSRKTRLVHPSAAPPGSLLSWPTCQCWLASLASSKALQTH